MMNKTVFSIFVFLLAHCMVQGQEIGLDFYFPDDITLDPSIPAPEEILGFQVGEWHARHGLIVEYMYALAEASDRIEIEEYARTYERRPLLLLTVSNPENLGNIDRIRTDHLNLADPSASASLNIGEMPVVIWMGYSIHGNEPSGSNAALLAAYYLAAAQGPEVEELLANSVILLDPSYNPDGLDHFADWANKHKSKVMDGDPNNREHQEVWPGSRTNHYWFDLNRDWMPVQHPSSRGRIAKYQQWKPNVLTDHHEMGTNSTFFFQPGVPSRNNPLTPESSFGLTGRLAEYHARFLDEYGQLYMTEEVFDDFYLGKGSTYPDLQGTIAILFEQASSRGHLQESQHGEVAFPNTIRNQLTTTLSTLRGSLELRTELNEHMRDFYREALEEAGDAPVDAYVFGSEKDPAKTWHLLDILVSHNIEVYRLDESVEAGGQVFHPDWSYIIPSEQPQYRFLTGLMETRTEFSDSLFYDVSTWTLPLAFNLPYGELSGRSYNASMLGDPVGDPGFPSGRLHEGDAYAYAFEWHGYYAPRALNRLLGAGVRVKVGTRPFSSRTGTGVKEFDYGTIMVSMGIQEEAAEEEIHALMEQIAREDAIDVFPLETGLSVQGADLGSNYFAELDKARTMVVTGRGVNASEAGELWHLLDQRYEMNLSLVEMHIFNSVDLDRYNTIILVNGNYSGITDAAAKKLKDWVRRGGTLVTIKNAARWAANNGFASAEFKKRPGDEFESPQMMSYIDESPTRGAQVIGGSIFRARLDLTHPLGYGFENEYVPVFRNSSYMLEAPDNPWSAPLRYTADPLLSGYVSDRNLEMLRDMPSIQVAGLGSGRVILMTDNPNFRAFWFGTNKLFANSLFFGRIISGGSVR
ncbi:MAG: M14 family zinc carboxypeptidase [Balneolales bacterium]